LIKRQPQGDRQRASTPGRESQGDGLALCRQAVSFFAKQLLPAVSVAATVLYGALHRIGYLTV